MENNGGSGETRKNTTAISQSNHINAGIKSRKEIKGISQEEPPAVGDCGAMERRDMLFLNSQGCNFSNGGAN